VEKRLTSPLLVPSSVEKIMQIDDHIGCAASGLTADARTLVEHARVESQVRCCSRDGDGSVCARHFPPRPNPRLTFCVFGHWLLLSGEQNHHFTYNEALPIESCTQSICDLSLKFGEDGDEDAGGMSRPFGVALLMAGCDNDGPHLYHTDPSGTYIRCEAKAIGSAAEVAQTTLKDEYRPDMTLKEAEKLALATLKQVMEEKITATNVDVACVDPKYRLYSTSQVEAVISTLD